MTEPITIHMINPMTGLMFNLMLNSMTDPMTQTNPMADNMTGPVNDPNCYVRALLRFCLYLPDFCSSHLAHAPPPPPHLTPLSAHF